MQEQVLAFRTLLRAMYNQPILISSAHHLKLCTEMADYYRCIPCLSTALDGSLLASPKLTASLQRDCCKLLPVAKKLQNKILFKECLVHVVGPWNSPQSQSLEDPVLVRIASRARDEILIKIAEFQIDVLNRMEGEASREMSYYGGLLLQPTSSGKESGTNRVVFP
jgi:hypothetical protein